MFLSKNCHTSLGSFCFDKYLLAISLPNKPNRDAECNPNLRVFFSLKFSFCFSSGFVMVVCGWFALDGCG
jgi:hypothetical protein